MNTVSRRGFLKAAAGVASAGLMLPNRAIAADSSDLIEFTSDCALDLAVDFLAAQPDGSGIVPLEPVRVIDSSGSMVGWSVDFAKDSMPYGYAFFDPTCPGLVSRYSLSEGSSGLYEKGTAIASDYTGRPIDSEPLIVRLDSMQFGVFDESSSSLYTNSGKVFAAPSSWQVCSTTTTSWDTVLISYSDIYSDSYTWTNGSELTDFQYVTESEIESQTGRYACAVTALYCIAGSLPSYSNDTGFMIDIYNDWDEYLAIWNCTGTTETEESKKDTNSSIILGETTYGTIGYHFVNYCAEKGSTVTYDYYATKPAFSLYKSHFNAYKGHATFDATILNSEGEKSGHTMAALGWATYTKGGKTVETLCVYDGWNEIQHINYADTYYVNAAGTLFTYSL